jgi:hypothetical protein
MNLTLGSIRVPPEPVGHGAASHCSLTGTPFDKTGSEPRYSKAGMPAKLNGVRKPYFSKYPHFSRASLRTTGEDWLTQGIHVLPVERLAGVDDASA